MTTTKDATQDPSQDATQDAPRVVPHTTPHHTTPIRTTSSRSDAQRGSRATEAALTERIRSMNAVEALTKSITDDRPDWAIADVYRAIMADDRPWEVVKRACLLGVDDQAIRHPNGLRYVNPFGAGPTAAERHPSAIPYAQVIAEQRRITEDTP